jgi:hypothetical protein
MKQSFYLIAFTLVLFAACKKDNPTPYPTDTNNNNGGALANCKYDTVYTVYSSQPGTVIYAYDDKDRIAKITRILDGKETISSFTYTANKVVMQSDDQTNQYFLNKNGFADTVLMDFKSFGNIQVYYTYNSQNQIVKQIQEMEIGGNEIYFEVENEYLNGNISSSKVLFDGDESIRVNEYHLDKQNSLNDMDYKIQFIPSNQNLMKASYLDGNLTQSYIYQFDSQNRIKSFKIIDSEGKEQINSIVWKCK